MVHRNSPVHPGYITNTEAEEEMVLETASRVPTSVLTPYVPRGTEVCLVGSNSDVCKSDQKSRRHPVKTSHPTNFVHVHKGSV